MQNLIKLPLIVGLIIFLASLLTFSSCRSNRDFKQQVVERTAQKPSPEALKANRKLQDLHQEIEQIKLKINNIRDENPKSALERLLVPIDKIERRIEKEESLLKAFAGKADEDDLNQMLGRLDLLRQQLKKAQKSYTYARNLDIQFEAGALFASGKYDLSAKGKELMQVVIKDTKRSIEKYQKRFPGEEVTVAINVEGYADKQPFYANQPEEERKSQNLEISQQRAESVGQFISQGIKPFSDKVEENFIGKGETLPPGVSEGPSKDPKRRICHLSILIYNDAYTQ